MGAEMVIRSFPAKLRKLLEPLKISHLEEVRLRADQPLMVVWNGKDYFVTDQGQLSMDQSQSWKVPESLLREAVEAFSSHSLYAYEEELRQGFFIHSGRPPDRCGGEGGLGAWGSQNHEISILFKCPDCP